MGKSDADILIPDYSKPQLSILRVISLFYIVTGFVIVISSGFSIITNYKTLSADDISSSILISVLLLLISLMVSNYGLRFIRKPTHKHARGLLQLTAFIYYGILSNVIRDAGIDIIETSSELQIIIHFSPLLLGLWFYSSLKKFFIPRKNDESAKAYN